MDDKEIIRTALKSKDMTQRELAEKLGLKGQANIAAILSRQQLKVATFTKLLNAMGYQVLVTDGQETWEVTQE